MPSVIRPNLKFLASSANSGNTLLIFPLGPISGMSQHSVYLMIFFIPSHQLGMLFVSKQTFQAWYYRSIPRHLRRDSLPRTFTVALNITRVNSPNLIPRCTAYQACIQILVLLATVVDVVVRTCMYLLDF